MAGFNGLGMALGQTLPAALFPALPDRNGLEVV